MSKADAYRPILCRLVDDIDFQALAPDAKLLWYTLRVSPECGPIGVFRFYTGQFLERTGLSEGRFDVALRELERARYISTEQRHLKIRNALRFEPAIRPHDDPKHLDFVHKQLSPFRDLELASEVLAENGLPRPADWPEQGPSKALRRPMEGPSKGQGYPDPDPDPDPDLSVPNGTQSDPPPADPDLAPLDPVKESEIQQVYRHYLAGRGLSEDAYKLTRHRKQKIRTRLKDFTVDALCAAIDACLASDWHMGKNDRGTPFCDLADHILKSEEKVESWLQRRRAK